PPNSPLSPYPTLFRSLPPAPGDSKRHRSLLFFRNSRSPQTIVSSAKNPAARAPHFFAWHLNRYPNKRSYRYECVTARQLTVPQRSEENTSELQSLRHI